MEGQDGWRKRSIVVGLAMGERELRANVLREARGLLLVDRDSEPVSFPRQLGFPRKSLKLTRYLDSSQSLHEVNAIPPRLRVRWTTSLPRGADGARQLGRISLDSFRGVDRLVDGLAAGLPGVSEAAESVGDSA